VKKEVLLDMYDLKIYEGEIDGVTPSGLGKLLHSPVEEHEEGNVMYEGNFNGWNLHGYGTWYDMKGIKIYEGEWVEGERHGYGKMYDKEGQLEYEGTMYKGKPIDPYLAFQKVGGKLISVDTIKDGFQTIVYENGSNMYKGKLVNGRYHGEGIFFFEEGTKKYEGSWNNGLYHGRGKEYYKRKLVTEKAIGKTETYGMKGNY
jgi:antitoxin component YwqK of YwqJK toxin-antitoxin module